MNFRDKKVTDDEGNEFVFTVEMQRRLVKAGLPAEPEYLSQLGEVSPPPPARSHASSSEESRPDQSESRRSDRGSRRGDDIEGPASIQIDPMTGKYIGRIKWYNGRKGYGFILRGGGEEIFFHRSNTSADPDTFRDGLWILYDVEETQKGPEATEVELYEGELYG